MCRDRLMMLTDSTVAVRREQLADLGRQWRKMAGCQHRSSSCNQTPERNVLAGSAGRRSVWGRRRTHCHLVENDSAFSHSEANSQNEAGGRRQERERVTNRARTNTPCAGGAGTSERLVFATRTPVRGLPGADARHPEPRNSSATPSPAGRPPRNGRFEYETCTLTVGAGGHFQKTIQSRIHCSEMPLQSTRGSAGLHAQLSCGSPTCHSFNPRRADALGVSRAGGEHATWPSSNGTCVASCSTATTRPGGP